MSKPLTDHVVAVVGGTGGLGLSAAHAILAAGGRVVAVGRDAARVETAKRSLGERAIVLQGDVCDSATSERVIATAIQEFGRFDGLYHVAGGSGRKHGDGPIHEATDEGIDFTLQLNLASVLYSNRAAIRHFIENDQPGVVLNMTSVLASSPSPEYFSTHVYAAAKAGIVGLTRSSASRYAKNNIRVNAIAPGLVETPMARRAADDEQIQRFIKTKQPLDGGRIGMPEDYDAAIVFLLSDQSRFVTGQVLAVDGGWSVSS
jgi:NAD(P)-dependent dehydrogenase (short-subunit alcohol dehydrogenase family)